MDVSEESILDVDLIGDDGSEDEGEAPPSSAELYAGPASTPTSCASSPRGEEPASPHSVVATQPAFFHHQPYTRPFFTAGRRGPGRPRKEGPKLTREGKIVRRYRGKPGSVRGAKRHRTSRDDALDDMMDEDDFTMPLPEEPPYMPEKWPGKVCALCNLSERSQLGQGEMRQIKCDIEGEGVSPPAQASGGATPTNISTTPTSTPTTPVPPGLASPPPEMSDGNQLNSLTFPMSRRQKAFGKCKTPLYNMEHTDELSIIGHTETVELPTVIFSTMIYAHEKCIDFSPQISEFLGDSASDDEKELREGSRDKVIVATALLKKCAFCLRLGASIPCKGNCTKYFHFPCVLACGGLLVFSTKSAFCKDHLYQAPLVCPNDIDCRTCRTIGDIANLMTCVLCGGHFHGICVGLAQLPGVRSGWACRSCRVCQVCRLDGGGGGNAGVVAVPALAGEGRAVACELCDKLYHAACLRPVVHTVPKYGWKCKCCRVCSDCGSRSPGAGPSSRWHAQYTVCDSCYQQRNKGSCCPLCRRAYRAAAYSHMIRCKACRRYVHGMCDPDADPQQYRAKKDVNPSYEYTCPICKTKGPKALEEENAASTSQDSSFGDENSQQEQDPLAIGEPKSDVGLGKGKPYTVSSKVAKKKIGGYKSKGGYPASGKLGFHKRQRSALEFGRKRGSKPKMRGVFGVPGLGLQRPQAPDNKTSDDDPGVENKLVLCSSKDKFVLTQDLCVMCGAVGTDSEGCLIACAQCGQTYHPYCVSIKVSAVIVTLGWRCLECTVCEGCGQRGDEARLVLCDDCDTAWHTYCARPPLPDVPRGAWRCRRCRRCRACGLRDVSAHHGNYTECEQCASYVSCCVCAEPYSDGELILQCMRCQRWLHGACDAVRTEDDAETCFRAGYNCPLCRPRDLPPPHVVAALPAPPPPVAPLPAPRPAPTLQSLGLAGEYYVDDVCLSQRGAHHMKMLEAEMGITHTRRKRRFKNENADKDAVVHSADGEINDDTKGDPGAEVKDEPGGSANFKEGILWIVANEGPPPEGFTIYTTDSGLTVLRRKRQRNLNKLGIGGFVVRQRQNAKAQDDDKDDILGLGESPGNKRKPRRKPRSRLMEQFPPYMQEAFFGKDLMEEHGKPAVTPTGSLSESPCSIVRPPTPEGYRELRDMKIDLDNSDTDGEDVMIVMNSLNDHDAAAIIDLNTEETDILKMMKPKSEKEDDPYFSLADGTMKIKTELDDGQLKHTEDSTALKNAILGPQATDAEPNVKLENIQPTVPKTEPIEPISTTQTTISPKDDLSLLGVNLDAMVRDSLPDMDSNDVEEIFKGVLTDDSQESQESSVSYASSIVSAPYSQQRPQLQSPMGYNSPYPNEFGNVCQSGTPAAASSSSGEWAPPAPSYNQRSADKMRADESLGAAATISAVLYANTNHPEWKTEYPNWVDRCKQILKKWRALPSEQKAPYLQRARDNRSAIRMKKAQQEQERACGQQRSAREAEQERQWKQLQQLRQQQTQQQQQIIHDQRLQAMQRMRGPDGSESPVSSLPVTPTGIEAPRSSFPAQRFPMHYTNNEDINKQLRDLLQRHPEKMWNAQPGQEDGLSGSGPDNTGMNPGVGVGFRHPLPVGARPRLPHAPDIRPEHQMMLQQRMMQSDAQMHHMSPNQQQQQGLDKQNVQQNAGEHKQEPASEHGTDEMDMGDMDKLEQDSSNIGEVGDILTGLGGEDDEELLESLTAEIGEQFNILEYADPELASLNDTEHILDGLDLVDDVQDRHVKREHEDEYEKHDKKPESMLPKAVKIIDGGKTIIKTKDEIKIEGVDKPEGSLSGPQTVSQMYGDGGPRIITANQQMALQNAMQAIRSEVKLEGGLQRYPQQLTQQRMQLPMHQGGPRPQLVTGSGGQILQQQQFAQQQHQQHFQGGTGNPATCTGMSAAQIVNAMQAQVAAAMAAGRALAPGTRLVGANGAVGVVRPDGTVSLQQVPRGTAPPPYPGVRAPPPPPYPNQAGGFDCPDPWAEWMPRRPLLLQNINQEQPLLLEELLEQEKREQERSGGEWAAPVGQGAVAPVVATATPSGVALYPGSAPPAPPPPPERVLCDADARARLLYEQWLKQFNAFAADQLRYYEAEVQKLRKIRKSLNSKQRQLRKSGNELVATDAAELRRVAAEQQALQKHLDAARKQARQHTMLVQEYETKQRQQNPQLAQQTMMGGQQQQMTTNQGVLQSANQSPQMQQQQVIGRPIQLGLQQQQQQTLIRTQVMPNDQMTQQRIGLVTSPLGGQGRIVQGRTLLIEQGGSQQQLVRQLQGPQAPVSRQPGPPRPSMSPLHVHSPHSQSPLHSIAPHSPLHHLTSPLQSPLHSQQSPLHTSQSPLHSSTQSPLHAQRSPLHSQQSPMNMPTSNLPQQSPVHPQQSPMSMNQSPLHQQQLSSQQSPMHQQQLQTQQSPMHQQQMQVQQSSMHQQMQPQQSPMHQQQIQAQQSPMHQQQLSQRSPMHQQMQNQQQPMHQQMTQQSPMHQQQLQNQLSSQQQQMSQQSPLHQQQMSQQPLIHQQSPLHQQQMSQQSPLQQLSQSPLHHQQMTTQQSPLHHRSPLQSPLHLQQSPMQQSSMQSSMSPQQFLQQLQAQRTSPQLPTPSRSPQIYQQTSIQSPVSSNSPQMQNMSEYNQARFPRPAPGCSPMPSRFVRPPQHQQGMRAGGSFANRQQTSPLGSPQPMPSPGNPNDMARVQMCRAQYSPMGGAPPSPRTRTPHASPAASPAPSSVPSPHLPSHGGGGGGSGMHHHHAPIPPGYRFFKLGLFGGAPIWPNKQDQDRHMDKVSILKRKPKYAGKTAATDDRSEDTTDSREYVLYAPENIDYASVSDDSASMSYTRDDDDAEEIIEEHLDDSDIVVVEPEIISAEERIATEEDFEELIDSEKPEDEIEEEISIPVERSTRTETTTKTVAVISLATAKQSTSNVQQYKIVSQASSALSRLPVLNATVLSPHANTKILNEVTQATVASVSIANQTISVPVLKNLTVPITNVGGHTASLSSAHVKKLPINLGGTSLCISQPQKSIGSVISVISSNMAKCKSNPVIALATSNSGGVNTTRMPVAILTQHQVKQKLVKTIEKPMGISLSSTKLSSLSVTHDITLPAKIFQDEAASPDSTNTLESSDKDLQNTKNISQEEYKPSQPSLNIDIESEISQHTELPHTLCITDRTPLLLGKTDIKSPDPIPEKIPDNIMEGDDDDKPEEDNIQSNILLAYNKNLNDQSSATAQDNKNEENVVKTIKAIANQTKEMVIDSNMQITSDVAQESVQISIPSPTPSQERYLNDITMQEHAETVEGNPKHVESFEDMLSMLKNITDDNKTFNVKQNAKQNSSVENPNAKFPSKHSSSDSQEQSNYSKNECERLTLQSSATQLSPLSQPAELTSNMANVSQQLRTIMSSLNPNNSKMDTHPASTMMRKNSDTAPTQVNFENLLPSSKVEVAPPRPSPVLRNEKPSVPNTVSDIPMNAAQLIGSRVNALTAMVQNRKSPNVSPIQSPVSQLNPHIKSPAPSPMINNQQTIMGSQLFNSSEEHLPVSSQTLQMPALSKIQNTSPFQHAMMQSNTITTAVSGFQQRAQVATSSILGHTLLQPSRQINTTSLQFNPQSISSSQPPALVMTSRSLLGNKEAAPNVTIRSHSIVSPANNQFQNKQPTGSLNFITSSKLHSQLTSPLKRSKSTDEPKTDIVVGHIQPTKRHSVESVIVKSEPMETDDPHIHTHDENIIKTQQTSPANKNDESQNVLLKQLLQTTTSSGNVVPQRTMTIQRTAPALGSIPSLEAQLARPSIPPPSMTLTQEVDLPKNSPRQNIAAVNSQFVNRPINIPTSVPTSSMSPLINTSTQSLMDVRKQQPFKMITKEEISLPECSPTMKPMSMYSGNIENQQLQQIVKKEIVALPQQSPVRPFTPMDVKKELLDESSQQSTTSGVSTASDQGKLDHPMKEEYPESVTIDPSSEITETPSEAKKRKRREYQQKKRKQMQMSMKQAAENNLNVNNAKKRPRKGSRFEEDYDTFIDNLMVQLKMLPLMQIQEPALTTNFSVCPLFGSGDLTKLKNKDYNILKGDLTGDFGNAKIPNVADYYNTKPFGDEEPLPEKPPASTQRGFYDQEFQPIVFDEDPEEKKLDFICKERDTDTPDTIVSCSSPEWLDDELPDRFPGLKLIEDGDDDEENDPTTARLSPTIPLIAPVPIRIKPVSLYQVKDEDDNQMVMSGLDIDTAMKNRRSDSPGSTDGNENVTVTLTLTSGAAEDILGVLKELAGILHIPPPTSYQIIERTATPPSHKLGLYRSKGKDGKEGTPIDIQSILNGAAKFCRHCDVVILDSVVRAKASEFPLLSANNGKAENILCDSDSELFFCSTQCYERFAWRPTNIILDNKSKSSTKEDSKSDVDVNISKERDDFDTASTESMETDDLDIKPDIKDEKMDLSFIDSLDNDELMKEVGDDVSALDEDLKSEPDDKSNHSEEKEKFKGIRYKAWSPGCIGPPVKYKRPTDRELTELVFRTGVSIMPVTNEDNRRCELCGIQGDGVADGVSRLLNCDVDRWVHLNCALWSEGVYETVSGALMNVETALAAGSTATCAVCRRLGATLRCSKVRCGSCYHLGCAVKDSCVFYKNKTAFCASHAPKNEKDNELTTLSVQRRVYVSRDEQRQVASVMLHSDTNHLIRVGGLIFLSPGHLLPHQLTAFHTPNYIYPIGYKIVRFYWSMHRSNSRTRYLCWISENEGRPWFHVRLQDDPRDEMSAPTPKAAWAKVLDAVAGLREARSTEGALKLWRNYVTGEDLFGLSEPAVVRVLESLPGVDTLGDYRFKFGRSALLEGGLAVNPSGCARAEPRPRAPPRRPPRASLMPASSHEHAHQTAHAHSLAHAAPPDPYSKQFVHTKSSQYKKMKMEWRNNVYLARSKIQGLGLYAARDLEKHTMVIEYIGEIIRTELSEIRQKQYEAKNRGVYMFALDDTRVIDATLSGGLARYINHSCNPNCQAEKIEVDRTLRIIIFTKRPIATGEELAYDYKFDIEDDAHKIMCMCGAPNCRKWMN